MSDESQIDVAQSFLALYWKPGASKPQASRAHIAQRYELCEDMANMLTQTAQNMLHGQSLTEQSVLESLLSVLSQPESVLSAEEARWVIWRLAELSGWQMPQSADSAANTL